MKSLFAEHVLHLAIERAADLPRAERADIFDGCADILIAMESKDDADAANDTARIRDLRCGADAIRQAEQYQLLIFQDFQSTPTTNGNHA